jgi:hypothetical protein
MVLIALLMAQSIDLITFRTANNPESKRLLQIYAKRYFETAAGRNRAGNCVHASFTFESTPSGEHAEYIAMWTWKSLEAREKWYEEFREIVEGNFERLGHVLDGVRIVANGGIAFELLDIQCDPLFAWSPPTPEWLRVRMGESEASTIIT